MERGSYRDPRSASEQDWLGIFIFVVLKKVGISRYRLGSLRDTMLAWVIASFQSFLDFLSSRVDSLGDTKKEDSGWQVFQR